LEGLRLRVQRAPTDTQAVAALATALMDRGDLAGSEQLVTDWLARRGSQVAGKACTVRLRQAEAVYLSGRLATADSLLNGLLTAAPRAPAANDALELLLRCEALTAEPAVARVFVQAERLERQADRAAAAQAWAQVARQASPPVAALALRTRAALTAADAPDTACGCLVVLLQEHADSPGAGQARVLLADLYARQGRWSDAISTCTAGLVDDPEGARAAQLRLRLRQWQSQDAGSAPAAAPVTPMEKPRAPER
jgi:tetratricopeptide (TPR) repeat protein